MTRATSRSAFLGCLSGVEAELGDVEPVPVELGELEPVPIDLGEQHRERQCAGSRGAYSQYGGGLAAVAGRPIFWRSPSRLPVRHAVRSLIVGGAHMVAVANIVMPGETACVEPPPARRPRG